MKKKTKKTNSINTYQAGGNLLSFLPSLGKYEDLSNSWNNYWRTGEGNLLNNTINDNNYAGKDTSKVYGDPTSPFYDPNYGNVTQNNNNHQQYQSWLDAKSKPNYDSREWADFENGTGIPGFDPYNADPYNPDQYKRIDTNKAASNSIAGIFTGLNYMNAYKPPEPIHFKKGFQGVQYQDGGSVNNLLTGSNQLYDLLNKHSVLNTASMSRDSFNTLPLDVQKEYFSKLPSTPRPKGEVIYSESRPVEFTVNDNIIPTNTEPNTSKETFGEAYSKAKRNKSKYFNFDKGDGKGVKKYKVEDKQNNLDSMMERTLQAQNSTPKMNMSFKKTLTKFKQQDGGNVNTTGYTPNTPSFNNDYNIIPSNQISMKETPFPVIGVPSKGKPMLMQPGQQYTFHGAKHVKELPLRFQMGGYVPTQDENSILINPIFEDVTEIQTEKGEFIALEDASIVAVKASKLHKNMKKDKVTDILPANSYIFSNDPSMELSLDKKVNGIDLKELSMGKGVFEYKENELTKGPEDIYFNKVFKGKTKATPAELANNIKNMYKVVESKSDFFTERANMENKEQRADYLSVLKALNEYKKPKSQRELPKAKFGMSVEDNFNVGLPKYYNNYNNAIDTYDGLSNVAVDPYKKRDNNFKSMYNISSVTNPKLFQYGGVPQAQLGKLLYYGTPLGAFGEIFGANAKRKQEKANAALMDQYSGYQDQYLSGINQAGQFNNLGTLGSFMSSLNTPLAVYDDMNSAYSTIDNGYSRANKILDSSKYTANGINAGANSATRYMDANSTGAYLASAGNQYNQTIAGINGQLANNELSRASALSGIATQGIANRNNAYNSWRERVNAASTQGIANLGTSYASSTMNNTNALYKTQLDKLAFQDELRQRAENAKNQIRNEFQGVAEGIGQAATAIATSGTSLAGRQSTSTPTPGPNSQSSFSFNSGQQDYFNNFNPSQSSHMVQLPSNLPPQLLNDPNVLRYLFKRN